MSAVIKLDLYIKFHFFFLQHFLCYSKQMSTLMFEKTRPILFVSLLLSILIRVFVIYKGYGDYLTKSYEIVTPLTSFTRCMLISPFEDLVLTLDQ